MGSLRAPAAARLGGGLRLPALLDKAGLGLKKEPGRSRIKCQGVRRRQGKHRRRRRTRVHHWHAREGAVKREA